MQMQDLKRKVFKWQPIYYNKIGVLIVLNDLLMFNF